jgi:hypothetical protein
MDTLTGHRPSKIWGTIISGVWARHSTAALASAQIRSPLRLLHPAWFEPFKHPPHTKFDHLGKLTKPFSMTKGGYVIVKKGGKVTQKFGSKAKEKRFAKEDRRGHTKFDISIPSTRNVSSSTVSLIS